VCAGWHSEKLPPPLFEIEKVLKARWHETEGVEGLCLGCLVVVSPGRRGGEESD
jgi:hypothetical protein